MKVTDIHIGELVVSTCKKNNYTLAEVASKVGISRQTFNGWVKKPDWSVKDLFTVSEVIGVDLVALFNQPNAEKNKAKVLLQIEIDEDNASQILCMLNLNELNIVKK